MQQRPATRRQPARTAKPTRNESGGAAGANGCHGAGFYPRSRTQYNAQRSTPSIEAALRQVCEALHAQAEPRSILVALKVTDTVDGLTPNEVTTIALVANELATNAIKHAYKDGKSGHIRVTLGRTASGDVSVIIDDDGLPFPELDRPNPGGLGLGLAKRLTASIGGIFISPEPQSKAFELRLPEKLRIAETA